MIISEHEMIAYEAFIRRASKIDMPFMLKGSYVTRQYFEHPKDRIPVDLDLVYMEEIEYVENAQKIFNDWATKVTELELNDGVRFRSFKENAFWRMIDYAMSEDFPTVNTDLICWVDGKEVELFVDISFNLDIPLAPISLEYKPIRGKSFIIPNTVPLALQVSWKLHQTLVRPRFKDMFDLMHLLNHQTFDEETLDNSLKALVAECKSDNVDVHRLKLALSGKLGELFAPVRINAQWAMWRRGENYGGNLNYEWGSHITDVSKLPKDYPAFEKQFSNALTDAGFSIEKIETLPDTKQKIVTKKLETSKQNNENIFTRDEIEIEKKNEGIFDFLANLFK